jgi:hypothetical protein
MDWPRRERRCRRSQMAAAAMKLANATDLRSEEAVCMEAFWCLVRVARHPQFQAWAPERRYSRLVVEAARLAKLEYGGCGNAWTIVCGFAYREIRAEVERSLAQL